jgi:hypothetical protein
MATTLTARNKKVGTIKVTAKQDSIICGVFENLADIAEKSGVDEPLFDLDDKDQQGSPEVTAQWGQALLSALEEGRLYRNVSPIANDGSLSMGIREYLGVSATEDIYDDADLGEERFEIFEGDRDNDDYPWVKALADFFSACGGYTSKGR